MGSYDIRTTPTPIVPHPHSAFNTCPPFSLRGRREERPRRDESSGRRVARHPRAYSDDTAVDIYKRAPRDERPFGDIRIQDLGRTVLRRYKCDHDTICDACDGLPRKSDDTLAEGELSAAARRRLPRRVRLARSRGFKECEPVLPVARSDKYPRMRPVGKCDARVTCFSKCRRIGDDGAECPDHDAEPEECGAVGATRIQTHEARRDFFDGVRDLVGLFQD